MNKEFGQRAVDKSRSTYIQRVFLKNGIWFPGYSKRADAEEATDKTLVLQNWILRMYEKGYLDENNTDRDDAEKIEYYFRGKHQKPVLAFILYQDYFEWVPEYYRPYLNDFLNEFYRLKKEGKDPYKILYISKKSENRNPLSLDSKSFFDKHNLRMHCTRIYKSSKRPIGAIKAYYISYSQKYLDGYNDSDERFFEGLKFG